MSPEVTKRPQNGLSRRSAPSVRQIARTWLPLAASNALMSVEGPIIISFVARFANPEINLAALGGIIRAITFAVESPLLMLLTASVTLSRDWHSYRKLRKYTLWGIAALTVVHAVIAFTPVYDFVTTVLISAPPQIVEPGRSGLMITVPYLAAVVYRRLNQGVLIRFGYSNAIIVGTSLRIPVTALVLSSGFVTRSVPGAVTAATAMTAGVWTEAIYVTIRALPVLRGELRRAPAVDPPLSLAAFLRFYPPLAMTSVALLAMQPVTSAALSRMPDSVLSLAVWPAVVGAVSVFASGGTALVDVVVTFLDGTRALPRLRQFTALLAGLTGLVVVVLAASPVGALWYKGISGLSQPLVQVALRATWMVIPFPVGRVLEGLYRGMLAYGRSTRAVTEAVIISSSVSLLFFGVGVAWGEVSGAYVVTAGFGVGAIAQVMWLWHRSRPVALITEEEEPADSMVGAEA